MKLRVSGELRAAGRWPADIAERTVMASRILAVAGERFREGDWIITGAIVQVPIGIGDEAAADFGGLAEVRVQIHR